MATFTYILQGRVRGTDNAWDLVREPKTRENGIEVQARTIKEALSRIHRSASFDLCFQPGIELRVVTKATGLVMAEQSRYDESADEWILTLVATTEGLRIENAARRANARSRKALREMNRDILEERAAGC